MADVQQLPASYLPPPPGQPPQDGSFFMRFEHWMEVYSTSKGIDFDRFRSIFNGFQRILSLFKAFCATKSRPRAHPAALEHLAHLRLREQVDGELVRRDTHPRAAEHDFKAKKRSKTSKNIQKPCENHAKTIENRGFASVSMAKRASTPSLLELREVMQPVLATPESWARNPQCLGCRRLSSPLT